MRTLLLCGVMVVGCGPARGALPPGVTCERWVSASGDTALGAALAAASSGTCVAAGAGQYRQALTVPQGVALVAEAGATVELLGGTDAVPAVQLGPRAVLAGVKVTATTTGTAVRGAGVGQQVFKVTVLGGTRAGVVFWCEEDCRGDELSVVKDTTITGAAVGLISRGVRVRVEDGAISKSAGQSLTAGTGVVAFAGAALELKGTTIDRSEGLGVLVDGAGDTSASFERATVSENLGRGVWLQGLTGTSANPRVKVSDCTIERNTLVGLGLRGSSGVEVRGGRIAGTLRGSTSGTLPGEVVSVGDGLGLFEQTGAVTVEGSSLEANQRSQALIDRVGAGVTLSSSVVVAAGSAMGVVVQRTMQVVQVDNPTRPAAGSELSVSAPTLGVPSAP